MRIAQASSSEDFTKYGIAPNQRRTGVTASKPYGNLDGELNIITWGNPWGCVYRAIDDEVAERIATFMERSVMNPRIGYSQDATRVGLFDELKRLGSDNPLDVTRNINVDCCTDIGAAIYYSGIKLDSLRKLCTWECEEVLLKSGAFIKLVGKELCEQGKGIRRGDILWRTGHVACALDTDPNYKEEPMIYYQTFTFNGVKITSGTPGTRAVQKSKAIGKSGYKPLQPRLSSVSNSALCNVTPFFGSNDTKLYVNYYRASGNSGTIDCTVIVEYVKNELTN